MASVHSSTGPPSSWTPKAASIRAFSSRADSAAWAGGLGCVYPSAPVESPARTGDPTMRARRRIAPVPLCSTSVASYRRRRNLAARAVITAAFSTRAAEAPFRRKSFHSTTPSTYGQRSRMGWAQVRARTSILASGSAARRLRRAGVAAMVSLRWPYTTTRSRRH